MWLFLAFLIVPLVEIALFIQVGGLIGLWPTLAIVIATAALGTVMVRAQGLATIAALRRSLDEIRDPSRPLIHGAMILVAGALLLTPGFFTDSVGFALLLPGVREAFWRRLRHRLELRMAATAERREPRPGPERRPPSREDVIEGDYTELPDDKRPTHRPSGWTQH